MCACPSYVPLHPEIDVFRLPCEVSAGWRDMVHTATITSQFFTERSMMLLLDTPEILLKLSFYVFYHGVLLLASQSSLNNAPPALIPQHALCFTVVLFGLYHTQFPITPAKNRSGSSHWTLHRAKPSPNSSG